MKITLLCGLSTLLLFAASASASTITISASGEFVAGTPASAFSGPDETWSLSFVVDGKPGVTNVDLGNYFDVDFSNFTYLLNGSPVAITPDDIRFFNASQYGGFNICFTICSDFNNPTDGFSILGKQMYRGPESAPTMLTGALTTSYMEVYVNSYEFIQQPPSVLAEVAPEPFTVPTLAVGLLLAAAGRRRRRDRIEKC